MGLLFQEHTCIQVWFTNELPPIISKIKDDLQVIFLLYYNMFYLERSSLSSWNDSEIETSINLNQNNNLLKAKVNNFSH